MPVRRGAYGGEEWLTGVREWLSEKPPTRYTCDYDAWAEERNERKPHLSLVASADCVSRSLVLPWSVIVKVAQRDISLADAQEQELERLKAEDGEFVSAGVVALIHGVTFHRVEVITRSEGFPNHAFTIRKSRIWHLSDVEAHHGGEPLVEGHEIAKIGFTTSTLTLLQWRSSPCFWRDFDRR